jgi:phosphatidylglycerol lysyltransferase
LFRWPVLTTRWFSFELPSLRLTSAILFWSFVDMAAAGAALWLLLPENAGITLLSFLPLYMLALGTALISNTPGGVGPFELVLLGALPHVPPEHLLQSIIAFRAIYYAGPACIGALALVRPFAKRTEGPGLTTATTPISQAARSESKVVEQNGGALVETPDGLLPIWSTAQTFTGMFAPVSGNVEGALSFLRQSGRRMGKWPLLYKASAKDAAEARRCGWTVLHIADDALLDPTEFTPDVPARRTLRRKLRAAAKAGVTVYVPDVLPFEELMALDADWSARLGPARGGTMGRYCPHYVQDQWVALAYQNDRAVAFVTFFVGPQEWTLDLMRQTADAPDGTMHTLVTEAIAHARHAGITQFSLAASPACPDPTSAAWRTIAKAVVQRAGGPGLRQFKSAFAPRWVPRYAAGPGPVRLAIALADIARAVHNPPPIARTSSNAVHEIDEEYELASRKRA